VSVTIRYFASFRERMQREGDELPASPGTVADVWVRVSGGAALPANTLVAVNLEYVPLEHPVADGDEVAFFPPVTGG
jgi:molybdopterin synthase sulfur carrier subunit